VALVAPTAADTRNVLVEGPSGILACSPPWDRPRYEPSKRRLTWRSGAMATLYSADEPERLRGPQHDLAAVDELGSWRHPEAFSFSHREMAGPVGNQGSDDALRKVPESGIAASSTAACSPRCKLTASAGSKPISASCSRIASQISTTARRVLR